MDAGSHAMAGTVWVIERGTYSDYTVVGVYTTREAAEMVCAYLNSADDHWHDKATVAEWPLNPGLERVRSGRAKFLVTLLYDGTVDRCEPYRHDLDNDDDQLKSYADRHEGTTGVNVTVWARDEAHAIKIANEKRAQLIASGELQPPAAVAQP